MKMTTIKQEAGITEDEVPDQHDSGFINYENIEMENIKEGPVDETAMISTNNTAVCSDQPESSYEKSLLDTKFVPSNVETSYAPWGSEYPNPALIDSGEQSHAGFTNVHHLASSIIEGQKRHPGTEDFSIQDTKPIKPFVCSFCGSAFRYKSALTQHERVHTGERPHGCCYCEARFVKKDHLNNHQRIHTGEKPYGCTLCSAKFSKKDHLKRHERVHSGERPFGCNICFAKFRHKYNLTAHEKIHIAALGDASGEGEIANNPFQCSYCDARFRGKRTLNVHERTHTEGEKPHCCTFCDARFKEKYRLKNHEVIHLGVRPYACSFCQSKFLRRRDLVMHERIHTGEKPFVCSFCGMSFNRKDSMKNHETLHTGDRRYNCSYCSAKFSKKDHVIRHERTHTGERPYMCLYCGAKFSNSSNMTAHERIHTRQSEQNKTEQGAETRTNLNTGGASSNMDIAAYISASTGGAEDQQKIENHMTVTSSLPTGGSTPKLCQQWSNTADSTTGQRQAIFENPPITVTDTSTSTSDKTLLMPTSGSDWCSSVENRNDPRHGLLEDNSYELSRMAALSNTTLATPNPLRNMFGVPEYRTLSRGVHKEPSVDISGMAVTSPNPFYNWIGTPNPNLPLPWDRSDVTSGGLAVAHMSARAPYSNEWTGARVDPQNIVSAMSTANLPTISNTMRTQILPQQWRNGPEPRIPPQGGRLENSPKVSLMPASSASHNTPVPQTFTHPWSGALDIKVNPPEGNLTSRDISVSQKHDYGYLGDSLSRVNTMADRLDKPSVPVSQSAECLGKTIETIPHSGFGPSTTNTSQFASSVGQMLPSCHSSTTWNPPVFSNSGTLTSSGDDTKRSNNHLTHATDRDENVKTSDCLNNNTPIFAPTVIKQEHPGPQCHTNCERLQSMKIDCKATTSDISHSSMPPGISAFANQDSHYYYRSVYHDASMVPMMSSLDALAPAPDAAMITKQETNYISYSCPNMSPVKRALSHNKKLPNGEKPHACSYCTSRFGRKDHLKAHERTHTGEKPYGCSYCNAKFTKNHHRKRHEKIHTREKLLACFFCGERFFHKYKLKEHEKIHIANEILDVSKSSQCNSNTGSQLDVASYNTTAGIRQVDQDDIPGIPMAPYSHIIATAYDGPVANIIPARQDTSATTTNPTNSNIMSPGQNSAARFNNPTGIIPNQDPSATISNANIISPRQDCAATISIATGGDIISPTQKPGALISIPTSGNVISSPKQDSGATISSSAATSLMPPMQDFPATIPDSASAIKQQTITGFLASLYNVENTLPNPPDNQTTRKNSPQNKTHFCSYCKATFSRRCHLQIHERIHTGERPFGCMYCSKKFRKRDHLNRHIRIHTGVKPYCCPYCGQTFRYNGTLKTHQRSHYAEFMKTNVAPGSWTRRPVVESASSDRTEIVAGDTEHSVAGNISNQTTGLLATTVIEQQSNLCVSQDMSVPGCLTPASSGQPGSVTYSTPEICNPHGQTTCTFTSQNTDITSLITPPQTLDVPKPFCCSFCDSRFRRREHLVVHVRTHTGEKPYSCSYCGLSFRKKDHVNRHEQTHTGERRYKCSDCNACFVRKSDLVPHRRIHTGEKPYGCTFCSKKFSTAGSLKVHKRIHTGYRPYGCTFCGATFMRDGDLRCHQRRHTGEKPYCCSYCGVTFSRKDSLKNHESLHSGIMPYSCTLCQAKFCKRDHFLNHQLIHTGEKPYTCSYCGARFRYKCNMRVHERKHEGDKATGKSE